MIWRLKKLNYTFSPGAHDTPPLRIFYSECNGGGAAQCAAKHSAARRTVKKCTRLIKYDYHTIMVHLTGVISLFGLASFARARASQKRSIAHDKFHWPTLVIVKLNGHKVFLLLDYRVSSWGIQNQPNCSKCQCLTFKVNFPCQKLSKSFYFFSLKNIILLLTFFESSIF